MPTINESNADGVTNVNDIDHHHIDTAMPLVLHANCGLDKLVLTY